ncbi:MAG: DsbA family protein [Hyphomicrobiales bacterium]|nr:DsbA family protein [Hyphomicrobiales bacterium]
MTTTDTNPAQQAGGNPADTHRLDAFIDLRSPYSYVALAPARALARECGLALVWRPYAIDVEASYGAAEERDPRALRKVKYIYKDARRIAAPQGLTIRGPKRIYDARNAHIAFLFARRAGLTDPFLDAVYEQFFSHTIDIEDHAALAALICSLGGSTSEYDAYASGSGGDDLASEMNQAEALGVFGVPSFLFQGELFWGSDRLAMIKEMAVASASR